jgi:TDG/mug DNA glycosylase family protein
MGTLPVVRKVPPPEDRRGGKSAASGWRPTRAELLAAHGGTIRDVIAPGLDVLFCGINPGLYSAATGHHFARPGNRFWPALHAGGFTPRLLAPWEERELLAFGCGVTNLVARGTASADELTVEELRAGRRILERKVARFQPRWVAVVGVTAYRAAFERPKACLGEQADTIAGARLWVLPNPSGLNAHHRPADFARAFRSLKKQTMKHVKVP